MYIDAILKIKTSIEATSAEALDVFGEGGIIPEDGETVKIEKWLAIINTPPLKDYVRIRTTEAFAMALEYIADNGGSVNADLVRVEWPSEDGYEPFTVEVENFDIDGNPDGTRMQSIGSF